MSERCLINPSERQLLEKMEYANHVLRNLGVGFDVDGTEVNSADRLVDCYNFYYGRTCGYKTIEDLTDYWAAVSWFEEIPGVGDPRRAAIDFWNSREVLGQAGPEEGAWILANYLERQNVVVHRITSRPSTMGEITRCWYRKWMPWVREENIHIHNTNDVPNSDFKVNTINHLGLTYYFEDSYEHAEEIAQQTSAIVILIPQPWNNGYQPSSDIQDRIIAVREFQGQPKIMRAYFTLVDKIVASHNVDTSLPFGVNSFQR